MSEYRSEYVLLYFFSRQEAEECTDEICQIREDFQKIKQRRVNVMAVSPLSVEENFDLSKKYGLTVRLLADVEKKVSKMYGAVEKAERNGKKVDKIIRMSILITPRGKIDRIYKDRDISRHADEILSYLESIPETLNRRVAPEDVRIPGVQERRFSVDK